MTLPSRAVKGVDLRMRVDLSILLLLAIFITELAYVLHVW